MTYKQFKRDLSDYTSKFVVGFIGIWVTLGVGFWSLIKWIYQNMIFFAKNFTGMTFCIIAILFILMFATTTIHHKQIAIQSSLRYDSLSRVCDSIKNCANYEAGFAAGVESVRVEIEK